jgi:hypothetical protein
MTATPAHILQRYTLLAICNQCTHTVELDVDGLVGTAANIVWDFNYGPKIKSRSEW